MDNRRKCDWSPQCCFHCLRSNKLLVATAVGVLAGLVLGGVLRLCQLTPDAHIWLAILGELFLRMLRLLILPLIMSCLITGVCSLEGKAGGRVGVVTLVYIFSTHAVSVILASIFSVIVQPGRKWAALEQEQQSVNVTKENRTYADVTETEEHSVNYNDIVSDFLSMHLKLSKYTANIEREALKNLFPDNIVRACLQTVYTERSQVFTDQGQNTTQVVTQLLYRDGTNMIGMILFSVSLGFAISAAGEEGKPLLAVFKSLSKVIFCIINVIFWYSPVAITSLIASSIVKIQDLSTVLTSIGLYMTTFLVCCVLHQFVLMPLIYLVFTRKNPFVYYLHILEGILTGFGPPSSATALPLLLNACKNNLGIDSKVANFVLPIAITINRDGSTIFVVVTAFFVAQSWGISLGFGDIVLLCVLCSVLAPAIAAVPSSSVILLITLASAVNIPIGDRLAVIMGLEWLQDRVRTTNNLASSAYGCAVIDTVCQKLFKSNKSNNYREVSRSLEKLQVEIVDQSVLREPSQTHTI